MHPTSLPGRFGIGDLGPEAFRFVDFLASAGQRYWQILPLGPTGYGDSPFQFDFIRAIWASVADTAIAPMPDLFGLGNNGRMNLPSSTSRNWQWRMQKDAITPKIIERLKQLTSVYGQ